MISYAQNFEDVMLARALSDVENGCYVDVGAQHPLVDSVSLAFYERGWRGVHIEPTPSYAQLLRQYRPDETVIEAAIGDGASLLTLFEIADSGLSTAREDVAESHRTSGFLTKAIEVPCLRLATILDRMGDREVHWLKIDVEGMEADVLRSWTPSRVRPWIVIIEATRPLSPEPNYMEWEPIILDLGYRFAYFDGLNRFYVSASHENLLAKLGIPPNVFDAVELSGTASNTLTRRLQRIVDDTRAELSQLDSHRRNLEATVEEHSRALSDSRSECETLSRENQEYRLRDSKQIEVHRLLSEENSTIQAAMRAKDQQIVDAVLRLEDSYRQRDMLRDESNRLQAEWRAQVKEMGDVANAERDSLYRVSMERENELRAQLQSITVLMRAQASQADDDRKAVETRMRVVEKSNERLNHQLTTILSHWTGKLYGFLTGRRAIDIGEVPSTKLEISSFSAQPLNYQDHPDALLLLADEDFIAAVYELILGRQVDQGGRDNYLSQLRGGKTKARIVHEIANSPEGLTKTPRTDQLAHFIERCGRRRKSTFWYFLGRTG